eukprot:c19739_g1_i1 orf=183-1724(+)
MVFVWPLAIFARRRAAEPEPFGSAALRSSASEVVWHEEGGAMEVPLVDEQVDFTTRIPEECLGMVFQNLGNENRNACALVCKRWYWVEAKARDRLKLNAQAALGLHVSTLMSRFQHIAHLSLRCTRKVASIENETLVLIGKLCKQLTRLKIKGCKDITDDGIDQFSQVCGSLKKLSCGSCGFGARGINAVLQHCSHLEDLSVKSLRRLLDCPEVVAAGKGRLRRLSLKDLFNGQFFTSLIAGSKQLQTLILSRNAGYWDPLFEVVTEQLPELNELHLESLRLSDRGLRAISRCSKLESLYLIKTTEVSDNGLCAIAEGCRNLKKLHLDDRKSNRMGDEGLLTLAINCAELQELVLIGMNVTTASLGLIASNCTVLERLALCNSEAIGDTELSCIAEKCHSLKKLCIKNCPISDHGLELFASACPNLSKMKVKKCKNVTSSSLSWLQMNRGSLTVSLDSSNLAAEDYGHGEVVHRVDQRYTRLCTAVLCTRTPVLGNRFTSVAGSFRRRICRRS